MTPTSKPNGDATLAATGLPRPLCWRIVVEGDHWIWQGKPRRDGYGRYGQHLIHRLVWELLIGPLAPGEILHHDCDRKLCCNPAHLVVTNRSDHPDNRQHQLAARTHCDKGHLLDGVKSRRGRRGERYCKTCHREAERARARRNRR
jgi:hypothetical protein